MPLAIELAAGRLSTLLPRRPAPPGSTARSTCSATGRAPTPGTGRCAPPSSGPTSCSGRDEQRLFRLPGGLRRRRRPRHRRAARRRPRPGRRPRQRAGPPRRRLHDRRRLRGRHPLPDAGDAAGVRARPAGRGRRGRGRRPAPARAGRSADRVDRRDASSPSASPRPTRRCAASCRTCGPRGGWPATAEPLDDAAAMVVALFDAVAYRDLVEIRGWAEELARRSRRSRRTPRQPRCSAPRPRPPTTAATTRGRAARPRGPGAGHRRRRLVVLPACRCRWPTWPAGRSPTPSSTPWPRPRSPPGRGRTSASPRSPRPTPATSTGRGTLNERGRVAAVSPTMRSWGAYVAGEIDERRRATSTRPSALPRARSTWPARSGATFLVGVATVGLLAVRAAAGRVDEALRGYREVIDYFARTGNWTHLWATLRNLADLLRRLGDDEPAALLDAAADRAPDAPADRPARRGRSRAQPPSAAPERCARRDRRPARRRGPGHRAESWPSAWSAMRGLSGAAASAAPGRLDERLLADPRGVALEAEGGDQRRPSGSPARPAPGPCGAATSGSSTRSTASPSSGVRDRVARQVDAQAVVSARHRGVRRSRDGGLQQPGPRRGPPGRTRRAVHAETAWWSGWPVKPSGPKVSTVSGPTRVDQLGAAARPRRRVGRRAAAVPVAEPVVLGDAEDRQAAASSRVRSAASRSGGQAAGSARAELAAGGGHAHHPLDRRRGPAPSGRRTGTPRRRDAPRSPGWCRGR